MVMADDEAFRHVAVRDLIHGLDDIDPAVELPSHIRISARFLTLRTWMPSDVVSRLCFDGFIGHQFLDLFVVVHQDHQEPNVPAQFAGADPCAG